MRRARCSVLHMACPRSCGNRHKGFLLWVLPGLIGNELLIPLGSRDSKLQVEFQTTTCFSLPQLPLHSSAQAVRESPSLPPYKPPQIFYFNSPSLFFPHSTTSFLQQQLKKSPCPDFFCCWGFLWFPLVRSFLGTESQLIT